MQCLPGGEKVGAAEALDDVLAQRRELKLVAISGGGAALSCGRKTLALCALQRAMEEEESIQGDMLLLLDFQACC